GRIAPLVSAVGDNVNSTVSVNDYQQNSGTSMSCPAVSGVLTQLYDCYKQTHAGANPQSALIKATLLNTCDDIGNAGADFVYGYGRVNAYKAAVSLENNQHFAASITQGDSTTFTLNVPSNVSQLKVMLYWHDYEGALNAAPALVNDLDLEVIDDSGNVTLPLVPNSAPNFASLISPATQKIDRLNNQEQAVINNPSGSYTFKVVGFNVPQGPQDFYVVYYFETDSIMVTYPLGGESVAPGELEKIRWDALGNTAPFSVSYSADSGTTWTVINANVAANRRYLDWTTPTAPSPNYLIKVERNGMEDVSDATFNLMAVPTGLTVDFACPDSIKISWNNVAGAAYYEASRLGAAYMDSNGTSTTNSYVFGGLNPMTEQWFSVKAYHTNGAVSRRAIAIKKDPGIINCALAFDAGVTGISPANLVLQSCVAPSTINLTIGLTNSGVNPISNFDVAYTVNNGTPVIETFTNTINPGANTVYTFTTPINIATPGNYQIAGYHLLAGDGNIFNDTLPANITIINSTPVTLPYVENFESFSQCNTSSDCEATICPLGNDLTNVTNGGGDDIDWRVNSGSTPSSTTGPSFDHTTGNSSGKYVYTEASNGCFFQTAELISPCIDLSNATNPVFSFYYHMFGDDMGDLHVDIFASNAWINDVIPPIVGSQPDDWFKQIVGLSNYNGQTINVRLR
ncbi:MAG TPA: S8 family serine peptidase, partial [Bacteroidia bacterium]|nr:S8 family serine peptidase [Bacteroidia bacterium]